jgi:hypothetical protein
MHIGCLTMSHKSLIFLHFSSVSFFPLWLDSSKLLVFKFTKPFLCLI